MVRLVLLISGICVSFALAGQKDISWDIKTGDKIARQVEKSIGIVQLPDAEKAVRSVGERLVNNLASNPYTFTFQIVDQMEPNAFALPGGHVYVSRGLLALLKNEDELAGVIGHEIIHVIQRHSAKQQQKAIVPSILAAPGVLLGNTLGGSVGDKVAAPLLGAGRIMMASYGRKQETEADELGIALAAKSGYDPNKLSDILNRIERWVQSETGKTAKFSLLNDHPVTPERVKNIAERSKVVGKATVKSVYGVDEFLMAFNQLPLGPNPSHGVFNDNIFLHPTLNIYWELPKGWNYINESTVAGATFKENQLMVTLAGKDRQLDTLIENFVNGYYAKTRKQPISDKRFDVNGRRGSEVILPGRENNQILYTMWFRKDHFTYVILGVGSPDLQDTFRSSTLTFRDLKEEDRDNIKMDELLTIKASGTETCAQLAQKAGNQVNAGYLSLVNNIPETQTFVKGEIIKTIHRRKYTPKS
ncbi:MAG: M48 family metalloprotease [Bacteroidetes bacterium]|nr:M48 family metalloprotease [Bacteroidota bacterium]